MDDSAIGTKPHRWLTMTAATVIGILILAAGLGCSGSSSTDNGGAGGTTPKGTLSVDKTNDDNTPAKPGGKLVFGLNAESDGFSPAAGRWAGSTYIVGFSIMDPLTAYDKDLQPQPYLAKSLESNADFTEWTIGLRSGVTLHNGQPVNAELVKFNLDQQKASPLTGEAMAFVAEGPTVVSAVDDLTVKVKMQKPWSTFPHILTSQVGAIASKETFTASDGTRKPVGSGPFVFESWETNKSLKVKKNGTYWRKGFPYLDNIEFQPMPDVQSRSKALESGAIDMFETSDPDQILDYTDKANSGGDGVQVFTDQNGDGSKIFIGLNMQKPPFNDENARLAVAYGLNSEALSEQAFAGVFPPAVGPFSTNSPFYEPQPAYPKYDPAKAKEYVKKYEDAHGGQKLAFTANITPDPSVQKVAQVLQSQATDVGIDVTLNPEEQITLIIQALQGDYQATGFILFGSPHLDREYVFIASPPKPAGQTSLNFTRIGLDSNGQPNGQNDKLTEAMNKARTTKDFNEQKKQYAIVQEEMAKNLNMIFLVRQATAIISEKDVRGAKVWTLPDASGGQGAQGQVTVQTMTFNLWLNR